jgi:glyoxylase-like metal-dependent hydrolase (beta-lactamase superfamily II)
MELYPGVHQIASLYGGRNLFQYLFVGAERSVLLDTGIGSTPSKAVFPYMEKIGLPPSRLTMAITMHADLDHQGGNAAIREASRATLLACHRADRTLVESPDALYALRYNHLEASCGTGAPSAVMRDAGRATPMDVLLAGGEILALGDGWDLDVWHVPGHSDGHLAVYDRRHRAAFTSDAVQAMGCPTALGTMAFGPTYYTVDAYLATIHFLEHQPIESLYTGHWPNMKGPEVAAFLAQSRQFVELTDELLPAEIAGRRDGATLGALIEALSPRLGKWPRESNWLLMWALYGHLTRLEQRGVLRREGIPARWFPAQSAAVTGAAL